MLSRNDLIELAVPRRRVLRILWIDPARTVAYAFDVHARSSDAELLSLASLQADLDEGRAHRLEEDPFTVLVNQDLLPPKHLQLRDRAWSIIRDLACMEPAIYQPRKRGPLIADYAGRHGFSHPTLYRYLRRYWQRGMTPNALLPDYANSGARGKTRRSSEGVKRGRPRKHGAAPGVNVGDGMRRIFRVAAASYSAAQGRFSRRAVYEAMVRDFFSRPSVDHETRRIRREAGADAVPTFGQFSYWLTQDGVPGQPGRPAPLPAEWHVPQPGRPGAVFQLDAVRADVQLVSADDRSRLAGMPLLYVVSDVFSGLVAGIHVSLEAPHWRQGMMALVHCAADKARYCQRFGRSIHAGEWPSRQLPEMLRIDPLLAGEAQTDVLFNNFGVRCTAGTAQSAWWREDLGKRFPLLDAAAPVRAPDDISGAMDAAIDIVQFTRAVIDSILEYNLRQQGPGALAPLQLWEWGLRQRGGALRQYPEETVRCCLLPTEEAMVTPDGICLHGLYYSCAHALAERWFERARQRRWPVRVAYDASDRSLIYLLDPVAPMRFHVCHLAADATRSAAHAPGMHASF
ncbi:Mu transposase C-terminal domain-containing protein [Massilia sp. SM-13]|uniref:Mu transposase C-terminal domain-containing protein n=1 Tax=Pseudoduganella rhizocola TaxID=3382643 RepID=UPI0038B62AAC